MRSLHGCKSYVLECFLGLILISSRCCAFVAPRMQMRQGIMRPDSSATWVRLRATRGRSSSLRMQSASVALDTVEQAQELILSAAKLKDQDPDAVIEAIRLIEKKGGSKAAIEGRGGEQPKFDLLTDNGNWRLVFTTGDKKTQKKIGGKISYVPIKAVQVFNPDYTITNGVYLGSFPLLKFAGTFTWVEEKSRLEFTFNKVSVLGFEFPYNQGESKVQPGFTFMDVSDQYVLARGAGGGLALWLRQDSV